MANVVAESLETLLGKLETFAKSETVVGTPTNIDGVIIVPLVEVTVGAGAGGGGTNDKKENGNGGGLGAKITPSAVLVINNGQVQLVNVKNQDSLNKLIDMVPSILSKFNLKPKKDKEEEIKDEKENDDNVTQTTIFEEIIVEEIVE